MTGKEKTDTPLNASEGPALADADAPPPARPNPYAFAPVENITEEKPSEEEIMEREETEHHDPTRYSPFYYKGMWGAFKGHTKGVLGGLLIGAAIGALGGFLLCGGVALLAAYAEIAAVTALLTELGVSGWALAGFGSAVFAGAGAFWGAHEFGESARVAGSSSAIADTQEERLLAAQAAMISKATGKRVSPPSSAAIDSMVRSNTIGDSAHLSDQPHLLSASEPSRKWFHGKIGLVGLGAGLGFGALLATMGLVPGAGILAAAGLTHIAAGHMVAGLTMAASGLFGASFGLERNLLRRVFDKTDKLFAGQFWNSKKPGEAGQGVPQHLGMPALEGFAPPLNAMPEPQDLSHENAADAKEPQQGGMYWRGVLQKQAAGKSLQQGLTQG